LSGNYDFSFSGLKTALMRFLLDREAPMNETLQSDIAAGYQFAIVESLVEKTLMAVRREGARGILIVGGVAANSLLRRRIQEEGARLSVATYIPSVRYCTDNGAMIAVAGVQHYERGCFASFDLSPDPNMALAGPCPAAKNL